MTCLLTWGESQTGVHKAMLRQSPPLLLSFQFCLCLLPCGVGGSVGGGGNPNHRQLLGPDMLGVQGAWGT